MIINEKLADLSMRLLGKDLSDLDEQERSVLGSIAERSLSSRHADEVATETPADGAPAAEPKATKKADKKADKAKAPAKN